MSDVSRDTLRALIAQYRLLDLLCESAEELAKALLSLADTAGMPDSFWQTDTRVKLARDVLDVPEDGRQSHAHLWERERV